MDPRTLNTLRRAEEAVTKLVAVCGKGGPLYARNPKAVAVSRPAGGCCTPSHPPEG
jgi:hypothetical protein